MDIVPAWPRRKHWSYKGPGYSSENIPTQNPLATEENISQASKSHMTHLPPPFTQRKKMKQKITIFAGNICLLQNQLGGTH